MLLALIGALCAVVFLSRWHDVQLALLADKISAGSDPKK
jgi:hypothetical protein